MAKNCNNFFTTENQAQVESYLFSIICKSSCNHEDVEECFAEDLKKLSSRSSGLSLYHGGLWKIMLCT